MAPRNPNRRQITPKEKKIVFEMYEGKCNQCGNEFEEGDYVEYDHIVPYAIGGKSVIENMQPLCYDCKSIKNPKDTSTIAKLKRIEAEKDKEFVPKIKSTNKLTSNNKLQSGGNKLVSHNKLQSNNKLTSHNKLNNSEPLISKKFKP